jgi:D-beta-D-heptose 7-phosphate kinase/D-beta-D-heptose 1-phosphate adenosyltransferase
MPETLIKLVDQWGDPRILVVGDVMLDRYVWGAVERISPEAPIPVMRFDSDEARLGGAGAVILNLRELGARPEFVSVTADDDDGRHVKKLVTDTLGSKSGLITETGRRTTVKTRFIGNVQSAHRALQHILRLDREETGPVSNETGRRLAAEISKRARNAACILVSDYDKGLLTPALVEACVKAGQKAGIPVIVDPKRSKNYSLYRGATGVTPNRYEARLATGIDTSDVKGCTAAAETLIKSLGLEWCAVTMDKDGQYLARRGKEGRHLPTQPRAIYDVTGAGDMVLASTGMALACGNGIADAVRIANVAAGVEVAKIGVATVSRKEIRRALLATHPLMSEKIKTHPELAALLAEHRRRSETVVMTNGCFDVIHAGHVQFLSFAKSRGDVLVVALNTDRSVRALKGEDRPVLSEDERAKILSALGDVDYVVLFDEDTPGEIIRQLEPDKLVKGEDWRDKGVVGREFVEARGGEVVLAPLVEGLSTSSIIERIKKTGSETREKH